MRIRIIFKLRNKGATLPFQHQHLLLNLVENMLKDKFSDFKDKVLWSFSGLKGQTKVGRLGLSYLSSRVTLIVSSHSQLFIDDFIDAVFRHTLLEIGEVILTPEFVEQEVSATFKTSEKYLCLSPLVPSITMTVENADNLLLPEILSDMLYDSTMHRMEKSGLYSAAETEQFYQFQLIPDKTYLQKINEVEKKAARSYSLYKNREVAQEIIGYTFPFELYAHPIVQDFIFNCGFGEFTNLGYGMIDKVNSGTEDKIIPYKTAYLETLIPKPSF